MQEIKVKEFKIIEYGILEVIWEDGFKEKLNLKNDLKKELFKDINENNFNSIQIVYGGSAIGWPEFDVEIGLTRWKKKQEVA
jgi:hypothetical protein